MKNKIIFDIDLNDLQNLNEDMVCELLEMILKQDIEQCKCQNCIEDIYSLSLKMLDSRYHPNSMIENASEAYLSKQGKFREKAENEIRKAVKLVSTNPHH